jgi:predicted nucleic acid-binding Zn ribbon protein
MCNTKITQAELKPFKVGEPLASNVDGNTEPSISGNPERACVETRRKVCIKCNNVINGKYKNAKYCSDKCRTAYNSYKSRVKKGLIKSPGVGSGGNQWGNANHQYTGKSGTGGCIRARRLLPKICNRCGATNNLLAHHIDHNRENNELSNFEILCKRCHQEHHTVRNSQGKYTKV